MNIAELNTLYSQLGTDLPALTQSHLDKILNHPGMALFFARESNTIVGSATVALYPIPTGFRCMIEDVVVDEMYRGKGIGELLILKCIDYAKSNKVFQIDLTSRPSRVSANHLYQKLGFKQRETNVYRLVLK